MKQKIYENLPDFIQSLLISLFNFIAYKKRYSGKYKKYLDFCLESDNYNLKELKSYQNLRLNKLIDIATNNSKYYNRILENKSFFEFPIITKEDLRKNIKDIYTISPTKGIKSKTGGTTGKSLEVYYTFDNMQERFAYLDSFRSKFGYKLGKKTAWFSGKTLLTQKDINKNRFWKTDYFYKIRYYSTFHINQNFLRFYIENLINYNPEYFVGFPSTILEIAKFGLKEGIIYPKGTLKAIFPTAESINLEMRNIIEMFFGVKMYDQYASSEGAPFIFECVNGKLHMDLRTGVFEILNNNNEPCQSGKLVLTSFTTEGTPLIRYDIGDTIEMDNSNIECTCGNFNPIVKSIHGRIDDFIYSKENGKINLGNVSNTLKDTKGIIKFQVIQNEIEAISILLVIDESVYNEKIEKVFLNNWRDRVGNNMQISITYVDSIEVEKSGKYRIVKNNIKHLIN
jgi:phenylacetate-CoA ligase